MYYDCCFMCSSSNQGIIMFCALIVRAARPFLTYVLCEGMCMHPSFVFRVSFILFLGQTNPCALNPNIFSILLRRAKQNREDDIVNFSFSARRASESCVCVGLHLAHSLPMKLLHVGSPHNSIHGLLFPLLFVALVLLPHLLVVLCHLHLGHILLKLSYLIAWRWRVRQRRFGNR